MKSEIESFLSGGGAAGDQLFSPEPALILICEGPNVFYWGSTTERNMNS